MVRFLPVRLARRASSAAQFFSALDPTAHPFIFALLAFAAGFLVRPFGAIVFGRLGDMIGRKYTFLVTILIMGLSTFIVGLLPNATRPSASRRRSSSSCLRLLQGLALGGEYGGAATYVAEHAPHGKRGYYTACIQTTATTGPVPVAAGDPGHAARMLGEQKPSTAWGWRMPFLDLGRAARRLASGSGCRLQRVAGVPEDEGGGQDLEGAAHRVASRNWGNLKIVLIALFGGVMGQGVVWYTGQFYALFFLQPDPEGRRLQPPTC
ncbi:MAG: MFS transporter [Rhodopseudomonas palustris]|nr:MFS transporter [Rhodopseudomonas palustris]